MTIETRRLTIICCLTDTWLDIAIYPNFRQNDKISKDVIISYNEDTIDSDIDIAEVIGTINGEPTWKNLFLSGQDIENTCEHDFFTYEIPPIVKRVWMFQKLDHFTLKLNDFFKKGTPELRFIEEDLCHGKDSLTFKTAIRLEALKNARQAIEEISKDGFAF